MTDQHPAPTPSAAPGEGEIERILRDHGEARRMLNRADPECSPVVSVCSTDRTKPWPCDAVRAARIAAEATAAAERRVAEAARQRDEWVRHANYKRFEAERRLAASEAVISAARGLTRSTGSGEYMRCFEDLREAVKALDAVEVKHDPK